MIRFIPLLLCAAPLFIMSPTAQAEEPAAQKPQLYDYNGTPVDPLCFMNNHGTEDKPVYPTQFCDGEGLRSTGESVLDETRFVSTVYEEEYFDPETDERETYRGFIGYRAHGHVETDEGGYELVTLVENGGGSGVFSSLMLLETLRDETEQTTKFRRHEILATGDRCVGGIRDASVDQGYVNYSVHATMYDLMFASGDPDRDFLKSGPIDKISSCAICCYAELHYDMNGLTKVTFPEERWQPEESNEPASCVENIVDLNVSNGISTFTPEEFHFLARELEHTCLGRVEGEE